MRAVELCFILIILVPAKGRQEGGRIALLLDSDSENGAALPASAAAAFAGLLVLGSFDLAARPVLGVGKLLWVGGGVQPLPAVMDHRGVHSRQRGHHLLAPRKHHRAAILLQLAFFIMRMHFRLPLLLLLLFRLLRLELDLNTLQILYIRHRRCLPCRLHLRPHSSCEHRLPPTSPR